MTTFTPLYGASAASQRALGGLQPLVEVVVALREERLVRRIELAELVANRLRDQPAVVRVEPVVRVTLRVHVAHRARDLPRRDLEDLHVHRRVEIPVAAGLHLGVAAVGEQRRQPPDLEFPPDDDEHVGTADLEDETGLRIDKVRVLIALRQRDDDDLVAADFPRERREIFRRRDDAQRRRRRGPRADRHRREEREARECTECESLHDRLVLGP